MRRFKAQMVTPYQITSRNWKGFKTPKKVMDFAKKSRVPCGWFTDPYSKKRTPLVDFMTWQKAWKYYKRTGQFWTLPGERCLMALELARRNNDWDDIWPLAA